MKKVLLVLVSAVGLTAASYAQKGTTQIGVAAEVGMPMSDFGDAAKTGFGASVKGLFGIGTAGQVTFTTGYTTYAGKDVPDGMSLHFNVIPLLAGYRHNFNGLFVEPQVGYGIYGAKVKMDGQGSASDSNGGFTWAVGAGYAKNGFEGGVRYQSASVQGSTFGLIGIHVGYNFSLGGSSK